MPSKTNSNVDPLTEGVYRFAVARSSLGRSRRELRLKSRQSRGLDLVGEQQNDKHAIRPAKVEPDPKPAVWRVRGPSVRPSSRAPASRPDRRAANESAACVADGTRQRARAREQCEPHPSASTARRAERPLRARAHEERQPPDQQNPGRLRHEVDDSSGFVRRGSRSRGLRVHCALKGRRELGIGQIENLLEAGKSSAPRSATATATKDWSTPSSSLHAAPASANAARELRAAVPRVAALIERLYSRRSAIIFLISAIALAGFRSFGQACVQFMIVWQRYSRNGSSSSSSRSPVVSSRLSTIQR